MCDIKVYGEGLVFFLW